MGDFADGSDVGRDVWALMPTEATEICTKCGAPYRLCTHSEQWALFDIPILVSGKLLNYTASVERTQPDCRVEGAGMDCPTKIFRSETAAMNWMREQLPDAMRLLIQWAGG